LPEPPPAAPWRRARYGLLLLLLVPTLTSSLTGPVHPGPRPDREGSSCQGPSDLWTRTELFFGSAQPDGSTVSEQEFRNASGVVVQERSMLLVLLYPSQEPDSARNIEAIREAYKRRFSQESVLRLDACARVSF
jgi:hypothetical protein